MVLKWTKWSWKEFVWVNSSAIYTHNGTLWGWSWKKLPCTKWWITLPKIDGLGWNFDTIWGPMGVTSGVNLNSLPILLLELSRFECVFNTLSNLLIRVHNRHNRHNGMWKFEFGRVWTCLAWGRLKWRQKWWKYTQKYTKCNGLERNQMVLKEPYTFLILTVLPVYLIKLGENGLERIPRFPPFAVWRPYRAKMTKYAGDLTYLTAYGWAYTSYDPRL